MQIKVGIITELINNSLNYGNVLQAYALNEYLNSVNDIYAETLIVNHLVLKKNTSYKTSILIKKGLNRIKELLKNNNDNKFDFEQRKKKLNQFSSKIKTRFVNSIDDIIKCNYDCIIVGSDIVWIQDRGVINRLKFLDFKANKKIAYAASFGKNYIPKENEKYIKKYLKDFSAISLRENNSIQILKKIGIENVKYVCDPTLLLEREKWQNNEIKVKLPKKYIFVYLLGKSKSDRDRIRTLAKNEKLPIVSIPHANGHYSIFDDNFAEININNCSPENWIYLINNASYVFTDSFHGTIFSVIFEKKFIVLGRENRTDINNRMIDFLNNIDQMDKYFGNSNKINLSKLNWNYNDINYKLSKIIKESKGFIKKNVLD